MNIDKKEAQKQLDALKADVQRLEKIINGPVDVKEYIKSKCDPMDAIFELAGTTKQAFAASCKDLTTDEVGWREVKMIAKVLNEGSAAENNAYYPYFKKTNTGFVFDYYSLNFWCAYISPLAKYKDAETALFAGKTFEKPYNRWYGTGN